MRKFWEWFFKKQDESMDLKKEAVLKKTSVAEGILEQRARMDRRFHTLPVGQERRIADA